jgi:hypothetical protein
VGVSFEMDLYIALIHHPVVNKKGDVICSAITNLDLHDIARAARTYGVKGYYVVNPLEDQKILAEQIIRHWTDGSGGKVNPTRKDAFGIVRLTDSLEETLIQIRHDSSSPVQIVATSARKSEKSVSFSEMKEKLPHLDCVLIVFGTAWGLSDDVIDLADFLLEPINGTGEYNHLSVRSAVTVILDRLVTGCRS